MQVTYEIALTQKAGDVFPCDGAKVTLTARTGDARKFAWTAEYTLENLERNTYVEPWGICLRAEHRKTWPGVSGDQPSIPENFVIHLPDISRFEDRRRIGRYTTRFRNEVHAELETLENLEPYGSEVKVAHRLPFEESIPFLRYERLFDGEPYDAPVLLREYLAGISLEKWCVGDGEPPGDFQGCDFDTWFRFAKDLLKIVHRIHLAGVPHGYICPANIIVDDPRPSARRAGAPPKRSRKPLANPRLVNFERDLPDPTLDLPDPDKPKAAGFTWRRKYDSPEKVWHYGDGPEEREFYDPFVPGDVFSLGLTLLYLVTGKLVSPFAEEKQWDKNPAWQLIAKPVLKSNEKIKESVYHLLRDKFKDRGDYVNVLAATEIIFACLRANEHRFYNVQSVLEVFERFHPEPSRRSKVDPAAQRPKADTGTVADGLEALCRAIRSHPNMGDMVTGLYEDRLRRITRLFLESDPVDRYTVGQSREEIVDALAQLLLLLGPDHQCCALTTPAFFFEENFGPAGRVMSAIKTAAARGAQVHWLFVMNEMRMNVPQIAHVMEHQKLACAEVDRLCQPPKPYSGGRRRDAPANPGCPIEIGWLPLRPPKYREFLRLEKTFVYVSPRPGYERPGQPHVLAIPDYAGAEGKIIAMRIFPKTPEERKRWWDLFDEYWRAKKELSQYGHRGD